MEAINFSKLSYDEIIELSNNQSAKGIENIHFLLQESIRHYFSRILMNTSAENPMMCNIIIDTPWDIGLSSLEKPTIISMYQDPSEGFIYIMYEGTEEYMPLEDIPTQAILPTIQAIEEQL